MELFVGGWLDCELSVLEMRAAFYREKEGSGTLLLCFCAHILTCIAAQKPRIIPPSSFLLFCFFSILLLLQRHDSFHLLLSYLHRVAATYPLVEVAYILYDCIYYTEGKR